MMSLPAMLLSTLLLAQAQSGPAGNQPGDQPAQDNPRKGSTTGDATSDWDPAGARATEKSSPADGAAGPAAPNPELDRTPRGSGDLPTIHTIYGQQSATYEDVVGTRKPPPGVVVPPDQPQAAPGDTTQPPADQKP